MKMPKLSWPILFIMVSLLLIVVFIVAGRFLPYSFVAYPGLDDLTGGLDIPGILNIVIIVVAITVTIVIIYVVYKKMKQRRFQQQQVMMV